MGRPRKKSKEIMRTITITEKQIQRLEGMKKNRSEPYYEVLERIMESGEELEMAQRGNENMRKRLQTTAFDLDQIIELIKTDRVPIPDKLLLSDDTIRRMKNEGIIFMRIKDDLRP